MSRESFEKKLFIARDIEGRPNSEELEIIRKIHEALSKYEEFVGVAVYGSVIKGYKNSSSDIDINILRDSEKEPADKNAFQQSKELLVKEIRARYGKKVHNREIDIAPWSVTHDLKYSELTQNIAARVLSHMCKLVSGEKINDYRRLFGNELRQLSEIERARIVQVIVSNLIEEDVLGKAKMTSRLNLSNQETDSIYRERERFWKKRVMKIFDLNFNDA